MNFDNFLFIRTSSHRTKCFTLVRMFLIITFNSFRSWNIWMRSWKTAHYFINFCFSWKNRPLVKTFILQFRSNCILYTPKRVSTFVLSIGRHGCLKHFSLTLQMTLNERLLLKFFSALFMNRTKISALRSCIRQTYVDCLAA